MASYQTLPISEQRRHSLDDSDDTPLIEHEKHGNASIVSCVSNLANTILGTGLLAMAHGVASGGIIPGALTILFSACTSALGLYFLSRCAARTTGRNASFFALSQLSYPSASVLFDLAIAVKCAGVSCSYLIITGALMPGVVKTFTSNPSPAFLDRRLWITTAMVILVPLCFLRQLHSLRFTSYIALVAVIDLLVVVVYKWWEPSELPDPGTIHLFHPSTALVSSLPVYIFAYTCAQNIFSVYNEIKDNSQERLNTVIVSSIGSAAGIYELVGILGYLTFGAKVSSNIMTDYHDSLFIGICRMAVVILVLFSYPLQVHPCRASVDKILSYRRNQSTHAALHLKEASTTKWACMTVFILIVTFSISMSVSQLEIVLGFVGATGSTLISFILPALFFLRIFKNSSDPQDVQWRKAAWCLLVYGCTVMVVCLSLNIHELLSDSHTVGRGKGKQPW